MAQGFQMSYFSLSQLKGLQNCDLSKLKVRKNGVNLLQIESDVLDKISLKPNMSDFFQTFDFNRLQFCSPLSYDDE